jgi:NAD(P)-dependent dehydrogenase (short-subunit alcohol dehydrogenase family)
MEINLEAPFRLAQIFAPEMAQRKWGRIINVCSVYANLAGNADLYPGVAWDIPVYVPSKHGLHGVTRYLAVRLAKDGVCVNSLSPGMFLTEGTQRKLNPDAQTALARATPVGRLGQEDDLQAAVVFLASPGAKFVTGQNLTVDGGWSVW